MYEGRWLTTEPHGVGRWTYQDGSVYIGQVAKHARKGLGVFYWPQTGNFYDGNWGVGGQMDGIGHFYWKSGAVYQGKFNRGKRTGKGKYFFPDGAVFDGTFKDGKEEGEGEYTFANGKKKKGTWKAGKLQNWL